MTILLPGDIIRFRVGSSPGSEIAGWGVVHHVTGGNVITVVVDEIVPTREADAPVDTPRIRYLRPTEVETVIRGEHIMQNVPCKNNL